MTSKKKPDAAGSGDPEKKTAPVSKPAPKRKKKGRAEAARQETIAKHEENPKLVPGADDAAAREKVRAAARALLEEERQAEADAEERSPVLESMPANAATNADIVMERFLTKNGFVQWVFYRGNWFVNYKQRWSLRSDPSINNYLDDHLRRCRIAVGEDRELKNFPVSTATVAEIKNRIQDRVTISDELTAPIRRVDDRWTQIDTVGKAIFRNKVVDIETRKVESADGVFYPGAADFDYDPNAKCPVWDGFLNELFENMPEERALLGQICGYILSGSTRFQKAFLIEGPPRAGKGVIGKVLTELVGEELSAHTTLQQLSDNFGLQELLDKKFLLSSDVKLSNRTDSMAVIEKILRITGNDRLSVGRKFTSAVQTQLGVRVMLLTNSLPRMSDDNEAFFSRFLIIKLKKSFLGKEDPDLFENLKAELSGVANWAMAHYRDLLNAGRFIEPESSKQIREAWYKSSNLLEQFIEECCVTVPIVKTDANTFTSSAVIYDTYKTWAEAQGIQKILSKNRLIHDLELALGEKVERGQFGPDRTRGFYGLDPKGMAV